MTARTEIVNWPENAGERFSKETLVLDHNLDQRPMFSDAGLISLLDRYPRENLEVFTMGTDPVDWKSWTRGSVDDLTGEELFKAVHEGRIWLNLRMANRYLADYADLSDEIFDDKEANIAGFKAFNRDLGVLISSPNAQVFYHLDSPLVSLWQIRGTKLVRVYRPEAPFAAPEQIESVVIRENDEQLPFDPAWDSEAKEITLEPGMMVTWPQNAPHRIVNGPMVNVSLSVEFMTTAALLRANVIYANGILRRRVGLKPAIQSGLDPRALLKFGLARAFKALKVQKAREYKLAEDFHLRDAIPGATSQAPAANAA